MGAPSLVLRHTLLTPGRPRSPPAAPTGAAAPLTTVRATPSLRQRRPTSPRSEGCQPPRHSYLDCRCVLILIVARHPVYHRHDAVPVTGACRWTPSHQPPRIQATHLGGVVGGALLREPAAACSPLAASRCHLARKLTSKAGLTLVYPRKQAVSANKMSPQPRCKAPPRDQVVSRHPRDEHRIASRPATAAVRPSTRRGIDHLCIHGRVDASHQPPEARDATTLLGRIVVRE